MKIYLVGGYVRDLLLGVPSKDQDYVCECSFDELRDHLVSLGVEILHEKPEFLTMRVRKKDGVVVDFACCRSEMDYDGRRPGTVLTTNLLTDLGRRDFTVNAMAMEVDENFEPTGVIIDPFDGQTDLQNRVLRFVGKPKDRIEEDGLRWLRAIRFCITKGFQLHSTYNFDLDNPDTDMIVNFLETDPLTKVSVERIREELYKCFKHDTLRTMKWLYVLPPYWMKDGLWLVPTLEQ